MKYLESILGFIVALAHIIFPAKKRTPSVCPNPFPDGYCPPVAPDERNGSYAERNRGDTGTLQSTDTPSQSYPDYLGIAGYSLMVAGSAGCLMKWLF